MSRGEQEARDSFAAWAGSRQHALLRSAYLMTGDLHRAEDLLQEALVKVALRWSRLRDGNPDAYIRTILYRDCVSWWRARREFPVAEVEDRSQRFDGDASEQSLMLWGALLKITPKQRCWLRAISTT